MLGEGSGAKWGGKWGKGGREVGEKGEGSGGMPTPLSTPSKLYDPKFCQGNPGGHIQDSRRCRILHPRNSKSELGIIKIPKAESAVQ